MIILKEKKAWRIMAKEKYGNEWYLEKFMTGGKIYYSFQEAQDDKNDLIKMASSMNYKVVRIQ